MEAACKLKKGAHCTTPSESLLNDEILYFFKILKKF